jgi:hypothetical protein
MAGGWLIINMMTKAYLSKWVPRKNQGVENRSDFAFDQDPEKAAQWQTKEEADIDCLFFNGMNIKIDSPDGIQHHFCRDFAVEERSPDKFVVFCMLPWLPAG